MTEEFHIEKGNAKMYNSYNPYNPYYPYNPYCPYNPYNPYNPYYPYHPYLSVLPIPYYHNILYHNIKSSTIPILVKNSNLNNHNFQLWLFQSYYVIMYHIIS